jgi:hypothetical protein
MVPRRVMAEGALHSLVAVPCLEVLAWQQLPLSLLQGITALQR